MAAVLGEKDLTDFKDPQYFAPAGMGSDPAECAENYRDSQLADFRISSAAAVLGTEDNASIVMISSDSSGLLWQKMQSIDWLLGYCARATFSLGKEQIGLELERFWPELNGSKSFSFVSTVSGTGFKERTLRMMTMSGNLFILGKHTLHDGQDLKAAQAELQGYINSLLDLAKQTEAGVSAGSFGNAV